jgi:hypothetical protein
VQGGWTPPSHNAVLDDHLTKLYAAAKSKLQSYEAALAERRRKAALLSGGKKMGHGRHVLTSCSPCYSRTSLIWTQQDLEELDNRMGNSDADEDGSMEEEQDESQQQDDSEEH